MLETYLDSPVTQQRLRTSPAADHIDAFADWLHVQGYKPVSIHNLLIALAGWTDWMVDAGFSSQDLLPGFEACRLSAAKERCAHLRHRPRRQSVTAAAIFIRFLRQQGVLPLPVAPPSASDQWPILGEFRSWMRKHRGVTETTLDVHQGVLVGLDALGDDGHAYSVEALRAFLPRSFSPISTSVRDL